MSNMEFGLSSSCSRLVSYRSELSQINTDLEKFTALLTGWERRVPSADGGGGGGRVGGGRGGGGYGFAGGFQVMLTGESSCFLLHIIFFVPFFSKVLR